MVRSANGTANPVAPCSMAASVAGWVRAAAPRIAPTSALPRWVSVPWRRRHPCRHDALKRLCARDGPEWQLTRRKTDGQNGARVHGEADLTLTPPAARVLASLRACCSLRET